MKWCDGDPATVAGMERLTIPQDSIEDGEKLAGDRDEGELSRLPGGDEDLEEGSEARRMARRDQSRDIERVAHPLATASDRALAAPCSAVVVVGGKAGQSGELL